MPRKKVNTQGETVLALDISLKSTGWAIVKYDGSSISLFSYGEITTNAKQSHGQRLKLIREALQDVEQKETITTIVKEAGFSRFPKETQALFKAHGVTEELFSNYGVKEYAPATIKKVVTGNGKAKKDEVEVGVRNILNLSPLVQFNSDDASDAVAVALTHLIKSHKELSELAIGGE